MSKRILIVDDNPDTIHILTAILNQGGYATFEARDGIEALQKIREEMPALILLDIMMPKLDGFGVMEAMRADPGMNQIPVLIISAKVDPTSKVRSIELGAKDYIVKPINPDEILLKVKEHLPEYKLCADFGEN
ncbi:MAG: response regulator transcription factor [Candidatus Manganitrophaceae bacterium]|nr:MAG: response regulator transcription factor [Candidatus Manganitrophaceae bacterium]